MQKPTKLLFPLVATTFAMQWLLHQSQIPNCPENGNNHHFLANILLKDMLKVIIKN